MNKKQSSVEYMLDAVIDHIDSNSSVWAGDTVFAASVNAIKSMRNELTKAKIDQNTETKGITQDKKTKFLIVNEFAMMIIKAVKGLANDIESNDLYKKVDFSITKLNAMRGSKRRTTWSRIKAAANSVMGQLQPYGIVPQTLLDFQDLITAYSAVASSPRTAKATSINGTSNVAATIKLIRKKLKATLDNNIYRYKFTNLEFYKKYLILRALLKPAYQKDVVIGNITDDVLLKPLRSVKVTILETKEVHKSSEIGNFLFHTMPSGTYHLLFTRADLDDFTLTVNIQKGMVQYLFVKMHKKSN